MELGSDPAGLYLLEHINLVVADPSNAEKFYANKLGCRRDMRRKATQALHMNCGSLTQFHLPTSTVDELPQRCIIPSQSPLFLVVSVL